ncbi:MAG: hypothetical protein A3F70_14365 [Acidobacteria bacterium RIFCSPLOWO2_12_FULL_67_14]|nr:MAG: hypothetical protein A3H29_17675 [Acidobacteria bacterium RIFCSPLOWO2_02_FULL_67_21]OFW36370.1 MAG: hypothetical protein A3F70_14365 [Acidobacteria bacterium RIFCSPLOWO2_12_FULL_67_14]
MFIPCLTIAVFLLGELPASAYVDPGTGSLLYQTALTVVLGLGLVFRRVRGSVVDFVKRLGGRQSSSGSVDTQQH